MDDEKNLESSHSSHLSGRGRDAARTEERKKGQGRGAGEGNGEERSRMGSEGEGTVQQNGRKTTPRRENGNVTQPTEVSGNDLAIARKFAKKEGSSKKNLMREEEKR
eukprot:752459-Hanusia_phi.AAC.7